jgi:hypothetical protein
MTCLSACRAAVAIAVLMPAAGCGIVSPSCVDESAELLRAGRQVAAGDVATYDVTSPKHSNLVMRLTWPDAVSTLSFTATMLDCGEHVGCAMGTLAPPFGPGGSSPTPQPWPAGLRELTVDGTRGKRWRIDVAGDNARDAVFTLSVTYTIACES